MSPNLHPAIAEVLTPSLRVARNVREARWFDAHVGRRRRFLSHRDARSYERGYSDGSDLAIGDTVLLRIHCPYTTGYYDAIEDADHRAFGS